MQEKLFNMLMQEDEITWQTIIYDLIKSGEMNPWDIDISILAQKYLETVKKLKEHNFSLSGKVLLAAAIMLRIKSDKLITEGIAALDYLMFPPSEDELEEFEDKKQRIQLLENPRLTIKTPLARKKRVSVDDLMQALGKALEVNERRLLRRAEEQRIPDNLKIPEKKIDIYKLIKDLYSKILFLFKGKEKLTFTELIPSERREDKIATFIPLLYLDNQTKINLDQKEHFGEIDITLVKN